jgi:hypothetical protein
MKQKFCKLSLLFRYLFLTNVLAGAVWARGQDSIVYFSGPSFQFLYGEIQMIGHGFDLDGSGNQDFAFQQGYFLCTADVPTSGCSSPFYVTASGSNAMLIQRFGQATILPFGAWIGNPPPTNSTWSNPAQSATVASYYFSPRYQTSALTGPLADAGVGYLGVRVTAADGVHYGWIRLQIAPYVGVIDWAYETRPNEPIQAGVIGSRGPSVQFDVNFRGPRNWPLERSATFILTDNTLRGELTFSGLFSSADILGSASRGNTVSIESFGEPLAQRTDYTSFFGNVTLSHSEINQLLHGGLYVSIEQGAVIGRISPVK